MNYGIVKHIRQAVKYLNPEEVRESSERPLDIGLVAPGPEGLWRMERYLCPPDLSPSKRAEVSRMLHRISAAGRARSYDLEIWDDSLAIPAHAFAFDPERPDATVHEILGTRPDLALPLARHFPPFRKPVIDQIVASVSKENAVFSVATALPDIVPLLSIPWAVGEFASDTAFLTMNQIRMTFMIAAASDCSVGYKQQRAEIGSIIAGAFGFRAIARELVAKIPLGGGLIPKAAIAWTGTRVIGASMERLYRIGYPYTREERRSAYENLFERGKEMARSVVDTFRKPQPT
jgi:hypothetical protein